MKFGQNLKGIVPIGGAITAGSGVLMAMSAPLVVEGTIACVVAAGIGMALHSVMKKPNLEEKALEIIDQRLNPPESQEPIVPAASELIARNAREAIIEGTAKLGRIRKASESIRAPHVKRQILRICALGDKIIQDFRDDPNDVTHARTWLDVYLDQTLDLVNRYGNLSQKAVGNLEAQRVMVDSEKTFDTIETETKKLLQRLVDNDIMGLDVSQAVIRQTLEGGQM